MAAYNSTHAIKFPLVFLGALWFHRKWYLKESQEREYGNSQCTQTKRDSGNGNGSSSNSLNQYLNALG